MQAEPDNDKNIENPNISDQSQQDRETDLNHSRQVNKDASRVSNQ